MATPVVIGRRPAARFSPFAIGVFTLLLSCGDSGPTGPDTSNSEILVVQGDGQGAEPGTRLPIPLRVRVQTRGSGAPVEGARILWQISEGVGARLDPGESRTDSLGLAATNLTLGVSLGSYGVRASVRAAGSLSVRFSAAGILAPTLSAVPLEPVSPGDIIILNGMNLSPVPDENVVTFSGVRARVLAASHQELQVEVPPCLLPREYEVGLQVGSLRTGSRPVSVQGEPIPLELEPGEDRVLDASEGMGCFFLPHRPNASYLLVPHSTAMVDGRGYDFGLVWLTSDGLPPGGASLRTASLQAAGLPVGVNRAGGGDSLIVSVLQAQDRWDEGLRILEAEALGELPDTGWSGLRPVPASGSSTDLPELGDKRTFKVLNAKNKFEKITAQVRYVTDHAILYEDIQVPAGGFTGQDLAALAEEFEQPIHPVVTEAFGAESDLDGNGRVIILFTPAVNRLTEPGSSGFIGGFFFGLDLLAGRDGSNEGEIFYSIVPDPGGEQGPVIGRFTALSTIPAILSHEFEHMVHFNQRMLLGHANAQEALWLSEGLAQMAEDLVGAAFADARIPAKAQEYWQGNWIRARQFLKDSNRVSLLASLNPGTLAERGAAWLLLKQLGGREGQPGLLRELVSSTRSGIDNITAATGSSWRDLVADWAGSLFLDGTGVPVRPELQVFGVDLRSALAESGGAYPLRATSLGGSSALHQGALWPSAPDYFIINPPQGGLTVTAGGGAAGARPEPALGLQTLVVRLQ